MNNKHIELIATELHIRGWQVEHAVTLFQDGATIPFVSRYRKEATGSLDEVQLAAIKTLWNNYQELDKRKAAILRSIGEQDKLTPELHSAIESCWQMNRLEDLYLPYRPKRKTRASVAREKGLEPLALAIMNLGTDDCQEAAKAFIGARVANVEDALSGARDIIAETVSENAELRQRIRHAYLRDGKLTSKVQKGKEEEGIKYHNYINAPSGIPLIQHSCQMLMECVKHESIGLTSMVDACSHAPARIFGISDRGFIREGYYADLVLIDPEKEYVVTKSQLEYTCRWSPLEGHIFSSSISHVFVNGILAAENGQIIQKPSTLPIL
jgi:uncharacterized protein